MYVCVCEKGVKSYTRWTFSSVFIASSHTSYPRQTDSVSLYISWLLLFDPLTSLSRNFRDICNIKTTTDNIMYRLRRLRFLLSVTRRKVKTVTTTTPPGVLDTWRGVVPPGELEWDGPEYQTVRPTPWPYCGAHVQ